MSGVLRLSNNVTGRSTIIASASNDQTFTLPATGGTLLAGGSSLEVIFPSGTEALPGLHVESDVNTGLYSPTANTLGISTDGTERLRIDSSGRVGIGTSSGSNVLNIHQTDAASNSYLHITHVDGGDGSSNGLSIGLESDGVNAVIRNRENGYLRMYTNNTERMRIDSSGNVGIGTTSPGTILELDGGNSGFTGTTTVLRIRSDGGGSTNGSVCDIACIGTGTNTSDLAFSTRNSSIIERLRIDSSGRLLVGTTSHFGSGSAGDLIEAASGSGGHLLLGRNDSSVTVNESMALIRGYSYGGSVWEEAGRIAIQADASHGSGNKPGRIVLSTTATSDSSPTERLRIDSSGRVGIGTSSFSDSRERFKIKSPTGDGTFLTIEAPNDSGTSQLFFGDSDFNIGRISYAHSDNSLQFYTANTERMRIDSSGRVGIGTSSSTRQLSVYDASNAGVEIRSGITGQSSVFFTDTADNNIGMIGYMHTDDHMFFRVNDAERMRIESTGTVRTYMVGSTGRMHLATDQAAGSTILLNCVHSRTSIDGGGTASCRIYSNGDVENTNNSYTALSDESLKENIVDANSQWDDIKSLRIRNFNFKEETGISTHTQIGVVAQEVELVSPGLVKVRPATTEEGEASEETLKTVNSSVLYMKAVKALQEAIAKIETLETKVAALEAG